MSTPVVLGVVLAGGLGAIARAEMAAYGTRRGWGRRGPTVAANLLGTLLLALVVDRVGDGVLLVVGGGFCGALTTFSTWVAQEAAPPQDAGPAGRVPVDGAGGTPGTVAPAVGPRLLRLGVVLGLGAALVTVMR